MSIASERLRVTVSMIQAIERDTRRIAREHGVKLRRSTRSGIDVTFADGVKLQFTGWVALRKDLIKMFNLAD